MNISISASKYVGYELLKFIISTRHPIKFVTTSPFDFYAHKIIDICKKNNIPCYPDLDINGDEFIELLTTSEVDFHFMLWFPTIVKKPSLESVNEGFVNLHPSILPHNRGMHPWYWSIVDETPAGVTIHFIDENIDEGDIITQKEVLIKPNDTGESLYTKLLETTINLFKDKFYYILNREYIPFEVPKIKGSFHFAKELDPHTHIDLNKKYKAKDLINIIRARSFKKGDCSYFIHKDKKYNLRLEIDEVNPVNHKGWDTNIYKSYEELPPTKSLLSDAWVDKEFNRLPLSKKDLKTVKERNSLLLNYVKKGDSILDFGGSLGFSYLACEDKSLKYHILETESICDMGKKLYQDVKFHSVIPTNLDLDILYIRTSLQYSQNWIVTLKRLLENQPKLLVFNHLSAGDIPTFICFQEWQEQKIPYWFINLEEFKKVIGKNYKLIREERGDILETNFKTGFNIKNSVNLVFKNIKCDE